MDKWTGNSLKRYLNVTLRSACEKNGKLLTKKHVLGLVEILNIADAKSIKTYAIDFLEDFELDNEKDIVASTHGGASATNKRGNDTSAESQLWHNHGINLVVTEVLHNNRVKLVFEVDIENELEYSSFANQTEDKTLNKESKLINGSNDLKIELRKT